MTPYCVDCKLPATSWEEPIESDTELGSPSSLSSPAKASAMLEGLQHSEEQAFLARSSIPCDVVGR